MLLTLSLSLHEAGFLCPEMDGSADTTALCIR